MTAFTSGKLLAITDRRLMGSDPVLRIRALVERLGPEVAVQIREKDLDARVLFDWVNALLPVVNANMSALFINGRADVARCFAPRAGVHLPENGLSVDDTRAVMPPGTPIGASAHDLPGVLGKLTSGASLVTIAPVFATQSKPGAVPLGLEGLAAIIRAIPFDLHARVFALGGIDETNVEAVMKTGAGGFAMVTAAWTNVHQAVSGRF